MLETPRILEEEGSRSPNLVEQQGLVEQRGLVEPKGQVDQQVLVVVGMLLWESRTLSCCRRTLSQCSHQR